MEELPNNITPPELARLAVERFIGAGTKLAPPAHPQGILAARAGAFVTLRTDDGNLRGCIGTIQPVKPTVAEEIIHNAMSAATRDPRFLPVTPDELQRLMYGVDVLTPPEPASGIADLDPSRYGVIIETFDGRHRGLLLPRIPGIDTVAEQWLAVHLKAGIGLDTPVRVQRFSVTRYGKD